jgi:hypothetical protein
LQEILAGLSGLVSICGSIQFAQEVSQVHEHQNFRDSSAKQSKSGIKYVRTACRRKHGSSSTHVNTNDFAFESCWTASDSHKNHVANDGVKMHMGAK